MHEVLRIERFKKDNTKSITNVPNLIVNNLIKLRKYLFCDYGGGGGGRIQDFNLARGPAAL